MKILRYILIYALVIITVTEISAQGVLITDDATTSPDTSALLELKSTSLGFLPPRLTLDQINSIATPVAGMMVYNTTKKLPMFYDGTDWLDLAGETVSTTLEIGDAYQGGIIFYLDGMGGGLIAATADADNGGDYTVEWGCTFTTTNATSNTDGATNTSDILLVCGTANIAADLCDSYISDGYTDWYLPALDQLDSLYVHKDDVGGFASDNYWSSTEDSDRRANKCDFSSGAFSVQWKFRQYRVRPIRTF